MKSLIFLWLFLCSAFAFAHRVNEQEPNNDHWQANSVSCGDTVWCAKVPGNDYDSFIVFVNAGDSLNATTFDCNGSTTNTLMVLYDTLGNPLAIDEDNGPWQFSSIGYAVQYTANYIIRVVRNQNSADTTYSLAVDCRVPIPEEFDYCATPRIVPSLPYYNEGTTYGMHHEGGTPAPDVFYRFHNPITGNYFIQVCSEFFNAKVQILGRCLGDYGDDNDVGCNLGADLSVFNLPPGDYWVMVEGVLAYETGNFSISITAQLPDCPGPDSVVVTTVGGYPFLDWEQIFGPAYYIVWGSNSSSGPYEHVGTTFLTYFTDSAGYASPRKFYYVTSVCPW